MRRNLRLFLVLLAALAALAACGSEPTQQPPRTAAAPEAERGLDEILAEFEAYAEKSMADWELPGMAIGVVKDGELVLARGMGVRKLGGSAPVDEKTVFRIGSTTKAFTSTLVAGLADEEKLGWRDAVVDHLDSFRLHNPQATAEFMVYDLMAQHSGMPAYAGDFMVFLGFDREHITRAMARIPPAYPVRSQFSYVNNLWLTAGRLIEKHTGESWEENMEQRIFAPLGMRDSSVRQEDWLATENRVTEHKLYNGELITLPDDMDWTYVYGPAGSVTSNIKDMARWAAMQLAGGELDGVRVVSEENLAWTHLPKTVISQSPDEHPGVSYYSLGWVRTEFPETTVLWHTGGTSGCLTMVALYPEWDMALIVLTNSSAHELHTALAWELMDIYAGGEDKDWSKTNLDKWMEGAGDEETPEPPAEPSPPLELEAYAGEYENPIYSTATVEAVEDRLRLTLGPKKIELELSHFDRDIFAYEWPLADDGLVFFHVKDDGAYAMTIQDINYDAMGTFTRKAGEGG